jgi:hypothetical protein
MNRILRTKFRRRGAALIAVAALGSGLPLIAATGAQAASVPSGVPVPLSTFALTASYNDDGADDMGEYMLARSVDSILDDANREPRPLSCETGKGGAMAKLAEETTSEVGMCWNSGDADTTKWTPQGITTTADAYASTLYDGRRAVAVTWYNGDTDQTRVTLMGADSHLDDQAYRHILLVKPTASGFRANLDCHGGGAAWYGHLLYVACTDTVRIFDWNHVYGANTQDWCDDIVGEGTRCAAGYALVMAQVGTLTSSNNSVRFSSLSIDRASSPDKLVVSEYSTGVGGKLLRYNLDYTTRHLSAGRPADAWNVPWTKVQGAITHGTKMWFNSSDGSPYGTLRFWDSDAGQSVRSYASAIGAESLSYWGWGDGSGGNPDRIYTLSEHATQRAVIAVRQGDVN